MGRISTKLRRHFQKALRSKILPLDAVLEGERKAESLPDVGQLVQDGHDPVHAVYKHTLNLISEFVFYGFVNFRADAIFLAGFPDRPQTLPHHRQFDPETFQLQLVKDALTF